VVWRVCRGVSVSAGGGCLGRGGREGGWLRVCGVSGDDQGGVAWAWCLCVLGFGRGWSGSSVGSKRRGLESEGAGGRLLGGWGLVSCVGLLGECEMWFGWARSSVWGCGWGGLGG